MFRKHACRLVYILLCLLLPAGVSVSQTDTPDNLPQEPKPARPTYWKYEPHYPADWNDKDNWTSGVPLGGRTIIDKDGIAQITQDAPIVGMNYHPEFIDVVIGQEKAALVHHIRGRVQFNSISMGSEKSGWGEYVLSRRL